MRLDNSIDTHVVKSSDGPGLGRRNCIKSKTRAASSSSAWISRYIQHRTCNDWLNAHAPETFAPLHLHLYACIPATAPGKRHVQ